MPNVSLISMTKIYKKSIVGLEEITSGELWIEEQLVNFLDPKDRDLSTVFQNYALYKG